MPTTPTAPTAPSSYTAPTPTGSVVTSYAELAAEVALAGPRVIVVADGTYTGVGLTTNQGHELWAQNMGGATLEFGIGFRGNGGNAGGALHGFVFDVDDVANVDSTALLNEAIVNTWDSLDPFTVGSGLVIEDCTFDGHDVIGSAIQAASPGGLTVRRVVIRNFLDAGISAFRNGSAHDDFDVITLEDIDIDGISRAVPGSASGVSAEIGVYLGHTFTIERIRIRNCAWAGIGLVNEVANWVIRDYDIDQVGWGYFENGSVGIYCEECNNGLIHRGVLGTEMKVGINCEWNGGDTDPWVNDYVSRNHNISIEDCTVAAYKVGIHFDVTVTGCTIRDAAFSRSWRAAILDNNAFPDADGSYPLPDGEDPIYTRNCADLSTCTFSLREGIPPYLNDHHLGSSTAAPEGWPATPAEYSTLLDLDTEFTSSVTNTDLVVSATTPDVSELEVDSTLEFSISDAGGISYLVVVSVAFADGKREVVHDGTNFTPLYSFSRRTPTANGFDFALRRVGGWLPGTTLKVLE